MNILLQNMILLPLLLSTLLGLCNTMHSAGNGGHHPHNRGTVGMETDPDDMPAVHPPSHPNRGIRKVTNSHMMEPRMSHSHRAHPMQSHSREPSRRSRSSRFSEHAKSMATRDVHNVDGTVNIMFGGVMIAETTVAKRLDYQGFSSEFFIPSHNVMMKYLMEGDKEDSNVYGGYVQYYNVMVGEHMARNAARKYVVMEHHALRVLNDHYSFNVAMMDSVMINGRYVKPAMYRNKMFGWRVNKMSNIIQPLLAMDISDYPDEPQIVNDPRRLKCYVNEMVVIDSFKPKVLLKNNMMPMYFVPSRDLMKSGKSIMWEVVEMMPVNEALDMLNMASEHEDMMGEMVFLNLIIRDMTPITNAIWFFSSTQGFKQELGGYKGIDLNKFDMCYLGGDLITPMTGPYWDITEKYISFKNKYESSEVATTMSVYGNAGILETLLIEFHHKCESMMRMREMGSEAIAKMKMMKHVEMMMAEPDNEWDSEIDPMDPMNPMNPMNPTNPGITNSGISGEWEDPAMDIDVQ